MWVCNVAGMGPNTWVILCYLPEDTRKELDLKQNSQESIQYSSMRHQRCKWDPIHCTTTLAPLWIFV